MLNKVKLDGFQQSYTDRYRISAM